MVKQAIKSVTPKVPLDVDIENVRDNLYRLITLRVDDEISMYDSGLISTREFVDNIAKLHNLT